MRNVLLVALLSGVATPAFAQEAVDWSGPYFGAEGSNVEIKINRSGYDLDSVQDTTYGILGGYRLQHGPFVLGTRIGVHGPQEGDVTTYISCPKSACGFEERAVEQHNSEGTVSASLDAGYAFGKDLLLYARLGAAIDQVSSEYCYYQNGIFNSCYSSGVYAAGPFFGAGVDYRVLKWNEFTVFVEGEVTRYDLTTPDDKSVSGGSTYRSNLSSPRTVATFAVVIKR